ncbi:glycosyltransferase family 4 protein [Epidermidibacterium keratini]
MCLPATSVDSRALRVLIANPSPDVYGADLQMLESVRALVSGGCDVRVVVPGDGPLVESLLTAGAAVGYLNVPVLRRASMSPAGLVRLAAQVGRALPRMCRLLRRERPDVLYVNTITIPWWLVAARLTGVPVVTHLHEAEARDRAVVRRALMSPMLLAHRIIAISNTARDAAVAAVPPLADRIRVIYNGVPSPPTSPSPAGHSAPHRLAVIGRLSPRKATHVALEATALLVARGYDVHLDVVGTCFTGYEWYEEELRARASRDDLVGRITFHGYRSPIWPELAASEIVLAPSLGEALGNVVIESQHSMRPVVATAVAGHRESIVDGQTGVLVPASDAVAMADAAQRLIDDPGHADVIAVAAARSADRRFSTHRYSTEISEFVRSLGSR